MAAATDAELRAVVRRMVRRYAPPPSKRPAELPPGRTVFDLPPLGVLPLTPAVPALVRSLALPTRSGRGGGGGPGRPRTPARPAAHTTAARSRCTAACWAARSTAGRHRCGRADRDATTPCSATARRPCWPAPSATPDSSDVDGLPLLVDGDRPTTALVEVAVAVPVLRRRWLRAAEAQVEVRRARGRAMSVTPRDDEVRLRRRRGGRHADPQAVLVDRTGRVGRVRDVTRALTERYRAITLGCSG